MKPSKMNVFRVLKWLALALAIIFVMRIYVEPGGVSIDRSVAAATLFVLFAIFFHLEQVES